MTIPKIPALSLILTLVLAAGCSSAHAPGPAVAPAGTAVEPVSPATEPISSEAATLTVQELVALEKAAGSTPALAQSVDPAPSPITGIGGTPGPSPAYGPVDAPVRIFLFTDFQCPVCPRAVEPLKHLARAYPTDVRIVLKENALAMHSRAARLAAASLAAFRQGKFWEYHDRLFANPARRTDEDLADHARELGLDVERFRRDMDEEAVTAQIRYETELAASIGLPATPGLLVNGAAQKGWGSYMGLEALVKRELERARKIAEGGIPASRVAYEATRQSGPDGERLAAALYATK